MRLRWAIGVWAVVFVESSWGVECPDFDLALRQIGLLKPISRSPEARVLPEELPLSGQVLRPDQRTTRLSDGYYVYLIDSQNHLVIGRRLPEEIARGEAPIENGQFLTTHRSLLARLELELRSDRIEIVAAGEFELLHGQMPLINDFSGTFPYLGSDRLDFVKGRLAQAGLAVNERTYLLYFRGGRIPEGFGIHAHAIQLARLELKHRTDPAFSTWRNRLLEAHRRMALRYPDPRVPGRVDFETIDSIFVEKTLVDHQLVLSMDLMNRDGVDYVIHLFGIESPEMALWLDRVGAHLESPAN